MKGGVELVAETSPPIGDDFLQDPIPFEDDSDPAVDVEVLEGNGAEMGAVKLAKAFSRWTARGLGPDASEVVSKVHQGSPS
jgi:hypothetical protein